MPHASYRIVGSADGWVIEHDGERSGAYALPEAAFEAVVSTASLDLKQRRDVTISVVFPEGPDDSEAMTVQSEPAVQRGSFDSPGGEAA